MVDAVDARAVARVLGGEKTLNRRVDTIEQLRRAVERGLPVESLEEVVGHITDEAAEVRKIMDRVVPRATRYRRHRRLKPEESERLERLARVVALAEEVWEDRRKARAFLLGEQPALGDQRPIDLAEWELGARQVENLLMELEYSLPA